MLTKTAYSGFLLLAIAAKIYAADNIVPPPPVPAPPSPSVPLPSQPQPQPQPQPQAPVAVPQVAVPQVAVPQVTLPAIPEAAVPVAPGAVPAENWLNTPPRIPQLSASPYLYQPAVGTYPFSQSQYNSFSVTGYPTAPISYSPWVGTHDRYPYYSYRRPWYSPGPASINVNIIW